MYTPKRLNQQKKQQDSLSSPYDKGSIVSPFRTAYVEGMKDAQTKSFISGYENSGKYFLLIITTLKCLSILKNVYGQNAFL